jgi:hypothetical protein
MINKPVAVPISESSEVNLPKKARVMEGHETISSLGVGSFLATYGVPFVADFLGVADFYKNDLDGETMPKVDKISAYLLRFGELVDFQGEILTMISDKLNINEDEKPLSKLNRIYHYISSIDRMGDLLAKKKKIEEQIEKEAIREANEYAK